MIWAVAAGIKLLLTLQAKIFFLFLLLEKARKQRVQNSVRKNGALGVGK